MHPSDMTDMTGKNKTDSDRKVLESHRLFPSSNAAYILRIICKILAVTVVFRVVTTYVFGIYLVKGNSMYPSLRDGDLCITYRLEPYTHSEVIAYEAGSAVRFARIAAAENDTVQITQDGILLINGYQPAEEIFYPTVPGPLHEDEAITVSQDEWYLLNDCRSDLSDSRTYGSFPSDALLGKLLFVIRRRGF